MLIFFSITVVIAQFWHTTHLYLKEVLKESMMKVVILIIMSLMVLVGCSSESSIESKLSKTNGIQNSKVDKPLSEMIVPVKNIDITQSRISIGKNNNSTSFIFSNPNDTTTHRVPFVYEALNHGEAVVLYSVDQTDLDIQQQSIDKNGVATGVIVLESSSEALFIEAFEKLLNSKGVLYAEPNYQVKQERALVVERKNLTTQWALEQIEAQKAWQISQGAGVVVAIIDTGVSSQHEDLRTQLWQNEGEQPNGIDDDNNGLIDDINGYDFVQMNSSSDDENGHGTHCAGIVAANEENGVGIIGIAPQSSVMAIKVLDKNGDGDTLSIYQGVMYALENGADILSISLGGEGFSYLEYLAFHAASRADVAVIVVAGNEGVNIDGVGNKSYPASFAFENIISVGASDPESRLVSWSNYGTQSVDIVAPGVNILSTVLGNGYEYYSGTSMATPYVAGVVALLKAHDKTLSTLKIKEALMQSGDAFSALQSTVKSGARLNAANAVALISGLSLEDEEQEHQNEQNQNEQEEPQEEEIADPEETNENEDEFTDDEPEESIEDEEQPFEEDIASVLVETLPYNNEMEVSLFEVVEMIFTKELTAYEIAQIRFGLFDEDENRVDGDISFEGDALIFAPTHALQSETQYIARIKIVDLGIEHAFSFVTQKNNFEEDVGDEPILEEGSGFAKQVMVFGVALYATSGVSDAKVLHAAKIMAHYLDNDSDGRADDTNIIKAMKSQGAHMIMATSEADEARLFLPDGVGQILFAYETLPSGSSQHGFDATIEEVLHLITQTGYAVAYPEAFGENPGSSLTNAMDIARGGRFMSVPSSYPSSAWYSYDDTTCNYQCMAAEYFYWALTSLLGGQEFNGRYEEIRHEWRPNTNVKMHATDKAMSALLTQSSYTVPTQLPDGSYDAVVFEVEAINL
jgi:subtilisin family serine protease